MVIYLNSSKGGCGRTTIATNLASYYSSIGLKTHILTTHPGGSLMEWKRKRLIEVNNVDVSELRNDSKCRITIQELRKKYDMVFIDGDCLASKKQVKSILRCSNFLFLPVTSDKLDFLAVKDFIQNHSEAIDSCEELNIKLIFNRVMTNTNAENLIKKFSEVPIDMFQSLIYQRASYSDSLMNGSSVIESTDTLAKEEISFLAEEILNTYKEQ